MFASHRIQSNSVVRNAVMACAAGVVMLCGAGLAQAAEVQQQKIIGAPINVMDRTALDEPRSAEVYYGDLNLGSEEGTRLLYGRILKAANAVCPDRFSRNLGKNVKGRECVEQAITRAVSEVGNERVAALDAARAKRTSRG